MKKADTLDLSVVDDRVLGVRTQIVISNSSLRERRGYTKFYYITDLFSVDMAIYDSIVSFQKIDAY